MFVSEEACRVCCGLMDLVGCGYVVDREALAVVVVGGVILQICGACFYWTGLT